MQTLDWLIVGGYCLLVTVVAMAFRHRAEGGTEDYFLSGRKLPWWLAGTSLAATAFSADTPLLITGLVRKNGIAGNWHWWFLALASVASLFFFARLWRRAHILSDMEFIEFRYGRGPGAALRGTKALLIGVLFNAYALGAWPVLGLTKILEEVTDWTKWKAVVFCSVLALVYTAFSGLWGVVVADFIHFVCAIGGAFLLAFFVIRSAGGFGGFWEKIHELPQAAFFPSHTPGNFWESPWIFFLSLVLIQWWARGVEGDGVAVQKLSACKNEKESFYAMLWFNIAHYALRPWPWILVGLASIVMLPTVTDSLGVVDHERAYPRMIMAVVPVGFRGVMIASLFAAYMSTVDSLLNWGSSYVVNDLYRRFVRKDRSPSHYVWVGRVATVCLMAGGGVVALLTTSIVATFYNVLMVFSGVGLVGIARWFWWRVNAWSEITAMIASGVLTLLASPIARLLGLPDARPIYLIIVVTGSTILWLLVTFLTKPTDKKDLVLFYERVRPAGPGWRPIKREIADLGPPDSLWLNFAGWVMGVLLILGAAIAIGKGLMGMWSHSIIAAVVGVVGLMGFLAVMRKMKWGDS
ncbi:MAG: sodium:solute symporter family protein [Pseudomonadota bacterium]